MHFDTSLNLCDSQLNKKKMELIILLDSAQHKGILKGSDEAMPEEVRQEV